MNISKKILHKALKTFGIHSGEMPYAERRQSYNYYRKVIELAEKYSQGAKSAIDIGCRDTGVLNNLPWINEKTAIDLDVMPSVNGATNIQYDFLTYEFLDRYNLALCLQVLEHVPNAVDFAQKILNISDMAIISVPYKWKNGSCLSHVHDPVDRQKLLSWTGRAPSHDIVVSDGFPRRRRLISIYLNNGEHHTNSNSQIHN